MLPYSICSTVDFSFSEEGIFRSDFNQRRTDIFPALPLIIILGAVALDD
jgi:hypothetical protein